MCVCVFVFLSLLFFPKCIEYNYRQILNSNIAGFNFFLNNCMILKKIKGSFVRVSYIMLDVPHDHVFC